VGKAERKAWAREAFLGAECSLLPSFKPGSLELDEEGIRHDVRQGIRQGFYSMFCAGVGLVGEERRRFVEIATDEAGDSILISTGGGSRASVEEGIESLRQAEALGCSHVMFGLPSGPAAETEGELFSFSRQIIESSDLGIVLYAQSGERFKHLHPSNVPINVFRRLAELPNVVGVKITQVLDAVSTFEVCEQLGEKLLLGPVNLSCAPAARVAPIQCTMMWQVDACGREAVRCRLSEVAGSGPIDEAVGVYRQMEPLVHLFGDEQAAVLRNGGHPGSTQVPQLVSALTAVFAPIDATHAFRR
jgi:4-hydroxy-tetrahydrodipicolinate synthase